MAILLTLSIILNIYLAIRNLSLKMRLSDEEQANDFNRIDHEWTDGDCCRCDECSDRFQKDLTASLIKMTDESHDMYPAQWMTEEELKEHLLTKNK
jgi:hypothetical protein